MDYKPSKNIVQNIYRINPYMQSENMNNKHKKQKKIYTIIAKVENNKFVKYNCNNLLSMTKYLDQEFKNWRWFNVYLKINKTQIASFTKNNKPQSQRI